MRNGTELLERLAGLPGFCAFLDEELGVRLDPAHADLPLTDLPRWDSLHVVRLTLLLEREHRTRVPLRALLAARSLREVHALVLAAGGDAP